MYHKEQIDRRTASEFRPLMTQAEDCKSPSVQSSVEDYINNINGDLERLQKSCETLYTRLNSVLAPCETVGQGVPANAPMIKSCPLEERLSSISNRLHQLENGIQYLLENIKL